MGVVVLTGVLVSVEGVQINDGSYQPFTIME